MLSAYLMRYVADTRTLRRAFDHLSRKGGQAPDRTGGVTTISTPPSCGIYSRSYGRRSVKVDTSRGRNER